MENRSTCWHDHSLSGKKCVWQKGWHDCNVAINQAKDYRQYCVAEDQTQDCKLGLFQDASVAGDLKDSISKSGGVLCAFGSRTFVPISWMCKTQPYLTAVPILKLFRLTQVLALQVWDCVSATISHSDAKRNPARVQVARTHRVGRNGCLNGSI